MEFGMSLLGFGQDTLGELYVLANETGTPFGDSGVILRIEAAITPCAAGDCNADGEVTVDELVTAVNIALGATEVSECDHADRNEDGVVTIDELILAVNDALEGC
jgi:hypothetical protein